MSLGRALVAVVLCLPPLSAQAQATGAAVATADVTDEEADTDLAQQLANPLASLMSVSAQLDAENRVGGSHDGRRYRTQLQAIVPFDLGHHVKVVTQTVAPIVWQAATAPEITRGSQSGFGDLVTATLFSLRRGPNIGVGPLALLPTATRAALGTRKLGLGPSAAALDQRGPFTYGLLATHLWSIAGSRVHDDFSRTTVQPFVAYTTQKSWTFSSQLELSYEWNEDELSGPLGLTVSKLTHIAGVLTSLGVGARYWALPSDDGPHAVALRFVVALALPNKHTDEQDI